MSADSISIPYREWTNIKESVVSRGGYDDDVTGVWNGIAEDNINLEINKEKAKELFHFTDDNELVFSKIIDDYHDNIIKIMIVDNIKEKLGPHCEFNEDTKEFKATFIGGLRNNNSREILMDVLKPLDSNFEYLKPEYLENMSKEITIPFIAYYGGFTTQIEMVDRNSLKIDLHWMRPRYKENQLTDDILEVMAKDWKIPIFKKMTIAISRCIGWTYRVKCDDELVEKYLKRFNNNPMDMVFYYKDGHICHDTMFETRNKDIDQSHIDFYVINKMAEIDSNVIYTVLF